MFKILFDCDVIGTSKLESGDPPMGCALGAFFPAATFRAFKSAVPSEKDDDPAMKRWVGLSVSTSDGQLIKCHDVVLLEVDLGGEFEFEVDVLGIDAHCYQRLFPDHVRAYGNQFK